MKASVKVMLSYDYSHFEVALSSDEETDDKGVNELRKKAQRLADEAVRQYKRAKEAAANREQGKYQRQMFENQIADIKKKPEGERTINDLALLKQREDENWEAQFENDYDYDDDTPPERP
jgi:hypothetical protein